MGSAETRDAILAQDPFRAAFVQAASSDVVLLSIGDMSERSLLMSRGLPADVRGHELVAAGTCGDLMGQLIDRDGQQIDHRLNKRCIALPLERVRDVPYAIIACGGLYKAEVLAAVLLAGWGNVLVCDEKTARSAHQIAGTRRDQHPPI